MRKPLPIQISIPTPCHEDWNKMTPAEQGRFCSSCQKCVIDFTNYTDAQLYTYIAAHKGQEICGRLNSTQLNRTLHIPPQPHSRLYRYFIGMGLTLILAQIPTEELRAKAPYTHITPFNTYEAETHTSDSITIKGKVIDEKREPVYVAFIELSYNGTIVTRTVTDEDGIYYITSVPQGVYTIVANGPGFLTYTSTIKVSANETEKNIQLLIDKNYGDNVYISGRIATEIDNEILDKQYIPRTLNIPVKPKEDKKVYWWKIKSWFR